MSRSANGNAAWGRWLRSAREGLPERSTQYHCAQAVEVAHATWNRWEAGTLPESPSFYHRIAQLFGVDVREVLHRAGFLPDERPLGKSQPAVLLERDLRRQRETESKQAVATAAVSRLLRLLPPPERAPSTAESTPRKVFIGDGTTATFFAGKLLREWAEQRDNDPLTILTNNLDAVQEYDALLRSGRVRGSYLKIGMEVAPGGYAEQVGAVRGSETRNWLDRMAPNCSCVISTTWFDAREGGPRSTSSASAYLKLAAIEHGRELIVLATQKRFGIAPTSAERDDSSIDAELAAAWERRLKRPETLWVISDLHPQVACCLNETPGSENVVLSGEEEMQLEHARYLREQIQDHFIVT